MKISLNLRRFFDSSRRRRKYITKSTAEVLEVRSLLSTLVKGGISSGAISAEKEVDTWTFQGEPGDRIELISSTLSGASGFNAFAEVSNRFGVRIASFWTGSNTVLDLNQSGPFTVNIRDDNSQQTGTYQIGYEGLKPISPAAGKLAKGGITAGSILTSLEKDQFTFTAKPGDRYEIITSSAARTSGFNAYTEVFAPSGTRVAQFWPLNNVILQDFKEAGTYMVQVRDDNYSETGTYTVGLEGLKPISPTPVALVKGGIARGSIQKSLEKDQYKFSAGIGDRYEIITTSTANTSGFSAYAEVFAPSGTRIAAFWPGGNIILEDFKETGVYMVQMRDSDYVDTGSYTIGLEGLKPISPNPVSLVRGGITSGSIRTALEKDQFTFSAKRGDRYEMITTSTESTAGFTAYTEVFAPSGRRITGFWPNDSVVLPDLTENGIYMVQVRDDDYTQTGAFTIGLESTKPVSPDSKPLAPLTTTSGSIGVSSEKDQWYISVPTGKKLSITLTETKIDSNFSAYADVYGPSGARVGGLWAGTTTLTLPSAGVYLIQVRDARYLSRGTYKLRAWLV